MFGKIAIHGWTTACPASLSPDQILTPGGPYRERIRQQNLLESIPEESYNYIIIDSPYPGLADGQYSDLPSDLANMKPHEWAQAMSLIACGFHEQQAPNSRCTVIIPNNRDIATGQRNLFPDVVRSIFRDAGYRLYDTTYASRRPQQKQGRQMAILNNQARRARVPMTEISEVLTFIKISTE